MVSGNKMMMPNTQGKKPLLDLENDDVSQEKSNK
jgi:hypothetical protein